MTQRSLFFLLALTLCAALIVPIGRAQEAQNQAGVVIRYGDGRVTTACVRFSEPSISGIELLQRASIPVIAQSVGMGSAVCKISNEGCDYPSEDCFCQCKGGNCAYWAYQRLRDDRWAYSPVGASASQVQPGDVDGWAWGAGSVQSGAAPPVIPLDQICSENPVAAPATAAAPATSVPVAPTAPEPTIVPAPTERPTIVPAPTDSPTPALAPTSAQSTTVAPATSTAEPATATLLPTLRPTPPPTDAAIALVATATPTAAPSSTATSAFTPIIQPTTAPETVQPTPSPAVAQGPDTSSYLLFGILVLVLAGGIVLALRRNRGGKQQS